MTFQVDLKKELIILIADDGSQRKISLDVYYEQSKTPIISIEGLSKIPERFFRPVRYVIMYEYNGEPKHKSFKSWYEAYQELNAMINAKVYDKIRTNFEV